MQDRWISGGGYEPFIGRWSRSVARPFLEALAVPPGRRWIDVGCGTGALTRAILTCCAPSSVTGTDPSEGFVAWAERDVDDRRVRFEIGSATDLPRDVADVVVAGLVLNFVPDAAAAVRAMHAAAPRGLVAAYVWDYADGMQLLRRFWDAAVALDPAAAELDEAVRFPLCHPERLEELWRSAGLVDVTTWPVEVPTVFRDVDDYWLPFLGAQGPAPTYVMSLTEEHRGALREHLRATLPTAADGSLRLLARAWAVRGTGP